METTDTDEAASARMPADARLETEAWLSVVQTYNQCSAALTRRLAPLGLSILQHEMLMNLLRTPGISQQRLAAEVVKTPRQWGNVWKSKAK